MKKLTLILTVLLIAVFSVFALASGEDEGSSNTGDTDTQQNETVSNEESDENEETNTNEAAKPNDEDENRLGNYSVVIDSCRLEKDWENKDIVIVKYLFTNVSSDEPSAFYTSLTAEVFQDGIGLNESYVPDDTADYSSDNQTKEIKKGSTIEVEVAYELNDSETDIEVEVSEWISFNDKVVSKTFSIA